MENRITKPKSCRECHAYNKSGKYHCSCLPSRWDYVARLGIKDTKNDSEVWQHCPIDWDKEDMHNLNTKGGKEQK